MVKLLVAKLPIPQEFAAEVQENFATNGQRMAAPQAAPSPIPEAPQQVEPPMGQLPVDPNMSPPPMDMNGM